MTGSRRVRLPLNRWSNGSLGRHVSVSKRNMMNPTRQSRFTAASPSGQWSKRHRKRESSCHSSSSFSALFQMPSSSYIVFMFCSNRVNMATRREGETVDDCASSASKNRGRSEIDTFAKETSGFAPFEGEASPATPRCRRLKVPEMEDFSNSL